MMRTQSRSRIRWWTARARATPTIASRASAITMPAGKSVASRSKTCAIHRSAARNTVSLCMRTTKMRPRTLEVAACNIHDFQKNGTALGGPGLTVNVHDTTVTGYGPTTTTAQNGIQVSYGAAGVVGPTTTFRPSPTRRATGSRPGILLYDADVDVTGNDVTNAQVGIYLYLGNSDIQNNVVTASAAGVGTTVFSGIVVIDPPHALPSPYQEEVLGASASAAAAPQAVITANVTGNTLTGSCTPDSFGVEAYAGYYGTDDLALTVSGNTIANWGYGVTIAQCTSGCTTGTFASALVNNNKISNNCEYGMYVDGLASPVNAESNYWGAVSGPGPEGLGTRRLTSARTSTTSRGAMRTSASAATRRRR